FLSVICKKETDSNKTRFKLGLIHSHGEKLFHGQHVFNLTNSTLFYRIPLCIRKINLGGKAMLVKNDYVNKKTVVTAKENDTMKHALKTLSESGYRCIPVLDETGKTYVGNIYKVHLLKYEREHDSSSLDQPLTELIANEKNGKIKEDDPFFKVFLNIKELPFLAVVNDEDEFLGILTNGNVIQVLENS